MITKTCKFCGQEIPLWLTGVHFLLELHKRYDSGQLVKHEGRYL